MEPRIQYTKTSDGVSIAVATLGEGPPLVMVLPPHLSHVQLEWDIWPYVFQPLARKFRLVRYNPRGSGLSDREASDFSMDAMMRDIEAVIARVGLDTFALTGHGPAAPIAVTYAATRPDRVSQLILVDVIQNSDLTQSPIWQADRALRNEDWVFYTDALVRVLWGIDDPGFAHRMAEFMRACVEPETHRALFAAMEEWDISALLSRIKAPTLVRHNRDNRYAPLQNASRLAAQIPNARFVAVDDIASEGLAGHIEEFVLEGADRKAAAGPAIQGFRTVLFTDIEGSTAMTQRLGDAKAREVLREHERITREALKAHGGSEVKTMGDGFMASFGSATKALECAIAVQRAFEARNRDVGAALAPPQGAASSAPTETTETIRVRIGLNAGEPIAEDDPDGRGDLFGTAVIRAARIAALAQGGEILAANVVRELAEGKGFMFGDRGEVALRGFDDPVRLFEVRWRD